MKNLIILVFFVLSACAVKNNQDFPIRNTIKRIIGEKEKYFVFDTLSCENGRDVFELDSKTIE